MVDKTIPYVKRMPKTREEAKDDIVRVLATVSFNLAHPDYNLEPMREQYIESIDSASSLGVDISPYRVIARRLGVIN